MEAIIGQALVLIGINAVLFLIIGLVILDNPLKLGIMSAVAVANCAMFFLVALFSSDSPGAALRSLGDKLLPFAILFVGFAVVICLQFIGSENKRRKVPRSGSSRISR